MNEQFPILESIEQNDYANYRHMMFMMPILLNAHTVVETGLGNGHSTRIWLESLSQQKSASLHTFEVNPDVAVVENIKHIIDQYKLNVEWYLHVGKSTDLPNSTNGVSFSQTGVQHIDLLYLDSYHSYENVYKELKTFSHFLHDKSVILLDDVWGQGDMLNHHYFTRNPGQNPSDVYYAAKAWADENSWKTLLFTETRGLFPNNIAASGKLILIKC
jgi:predicted O-methyltransferase YrrM